MGQIIKNKQIISTWNLGLDPGKTGEIQTKSTLVNSNVLMLISYFLQMYHNYVKWKTW